MTRRVSYAGLDLRTHADVLELEKRIENVAEEACEQVAGVFPLSESSTGAMGQARAAIEAAAAR